MPGFTQLQVWRKAHALALNVHRLARGIRGTAYTSLRSQMIRAAMSIPANIVEGRGQRSDRDFSRFLGYAINSSSELEYHLIAARDMHMIAEADFRAIRSDVIEVRKMLHGLLARLSRATAGGRPPNEGRSTPPPSGSHEADR